MTFPENGVRVTNPARAGSTRVVNNEAPRIGQAEHVAKVAFARQQRRHRPIEGARVFHLRDDDRAAAGGAQLFDRPVGFLPVLRRLSASVVLPAASAAAIR